MRDIHSRFPCGRFDAVARMGGREGKGEGGGAHMVLARNIDSTVIHRKLMIKIEENNNFLGIREEKEIKI